MSLNNLKLIVHECISDNTIKVADYGVAINECFESEKDGKLWVTNGEYSNSVNYCPFCGYKSK